MPCYRKHKRNKQAIVTLNGKDFYLGPYGSKAHFVMAKLDRLARNVASTSPLMDSGVDFVCCDNRPSMILNPCATHL